MNAGEILAQYDFIKIAISNELMQRAVIERGARQAAGNPTSFQQGTGVNLTKNDGIVNRLIPGENNANIRSAAPVRGTSPLSAQKMNNVTAQNPNIGNAVINRAQQIRGNVLNNKPVTSPNQTMSSFMANKPKPTMPIAGNAIKGKSLLAGRLGKGLAVGGLMAGAGYLGNKLLGSSDKTASLIESTLDNIGLGILAVPSVAGLAGHPMSDRNKEIAEVGGLGILAAHPTYEMGHAAVNAIKGLPGQGNGLVQRAGQGIGNVVNKLRGAAPVLSKLAYNSFYQEILK